VKLYNTLIFLLALALNKHGLKMPVLANGQPTFRSTIFFQSTFWAT